jgi:hypothetical protein
VANDPTLKIRVTGDLTALRQQLQLVGAGFDNLATTAREAGTEASLGLNSSEQAARALTEQLNRGAAATRTQRDAQRQAAREAKRAAEEQLRLQRRAESEARRAARQTEEESKRRQRREEAEARRRLQRQQQEADRLRRQESFRAAQVAPQITDIVTQLGSGSNPAIVLLQQGGQLRDIFGGVREAIIGTGKAVLGLVGPIGVAVGVIGALAAAYFKGQDEALRFNRTLLLTGNSAGQTSERMQALAADMDRMTGVTRASAAAALNAALETGRFVGAQVEMVARTAERLRTTVGKDVSETVAEFSRLGEDPVAGANELNRRVNFLTGSLREQIRTLAEQGRTQEAATLAMNAYADAVEERTPKIRENLGYIQRGWQAVKKVMGDTVDAVLNIGRESLGQERFDELVRERQQLLEELAQGGAYSTQAFGMFIKDTPEMRRARQARVFQLEAEMRLMQEERQRVDQEAARDAARARAGQLQEELVTEARQYEEAAERRVRLRTAANNRANEAIAQARIAGDEAAERVAVEARDRIIAALDKQESEEEERRAEEAKRRAEQMARERAEAAKAAAAIVGIDAGLVRDNAQRTLAELNRMYQDGLVNLRDYFAEKARLETEAIDASIRAAQADLEAARTADERRRVEAQITVLQRDRAAVGANAAREQAEAERELARALEDVQDRLAEAGGDSLARRTREIERQREELLRKFGQDPGASALVERLFDVEMARARAQGIEAEAERLLEALRRREENIAVQIDAGTLGQVTGEEQLQDARARTIRQLEELREALRAAYGETPTSAELASLEQLDTEIARVRSTANKFQNDLRDLEQSSLTGFFTNLASGAMSVSQAVKQMVVDFVQGLARMAAEALAKRAILALAGGGGSVVASVLHGGGVAGRGGVKRAIPVGAAAALFALAPRFHDGGIAGLKPGEVPAILQAGERVLSREQTAAMGQQQQAAPGMRVVNVFDPNFVPDQMDSAAGEKVILNVIGKNPGRVRQILG